MPVLYEGEDDWSPPRKPRFERTFADRIFAIEAASFDSSGLQTVSDPVGTQAFEPGSWPDKIHVDFKPFRPGEIISPAKPPHWTDILANAHAAGERWGLIVRQADEKYKTYNPAFDRDFASPDGLIRITCNKSKLLVALFSDLPSQCYLRGLDVQDNVEIDASMPARYLPAWREIMVRSELMLRKWRVR